jgi:hypothetical protein
MVNGQWSMIDKFTIDHSPLPFYPKRYKVILPHKAFAANLIGLAHSPFTIDHSPLTFYPKCYKVFLPHKTFAANLIGLAPYKPIGVFSQALSAIKTL